MEAQDALETLKETVYRMTNDLVIAKNRVEYYKSEAEYWRGIATRLSVDELREKAREYWNEKISTDAPCAVKADC